MIYVLYYRDGRDSTGSEPEIDTFKTIDKMGKVQKNHCRCQLYDIPTTYEHRKSHY